MKKPIGALLFVFWFLATTLPSETVHAKRARGTQARGGLNAHSAILVDMRDGRILYEQDPDAPIAPASITKVLTLYIVFEALKEGRLQPWENVHVSKRAAQTGGSRMGLKTGHIVPVEELIKGMAVVSGNDACVAIAEHMSGTVEDFVRLMNRKARELGMTHSNFTTPNGLPSPGQYSTARDLAKLSVAYLRRFPESLSIHSMQSYTYRGITHHNANRLLGTCPGVDGLKTGFVCSAGYNQTATCKRGETRLLAVVLGAPSPGVRAAETTRILELGYQALASGSPVIQMDQPVRMASERSPGVETVPSQKTATTLRTKRLHVAGKEDSLRAAGMPGRRVASKTASTAGKPQNQISTGTCVPVASSQPVSVKSVRMGSKKEDSAQAKQAKAKAPTASMVSGNREASATKIGTTAANASGTAGVKTSETPKVGSAAKTAKSSRSGAPVQGSDKAPALPKSKESSSKKSSANPNTPSQTAKKKPAP